MQTNQGFEHQTDRLLKLADVEKMAGISKSLIYKLMSENRFPAGKTVGVRGRRWKASEIQAWVAEE